VVSGAIGKDIRGYIEGGFKKLKGLGTWKRIKMAAGGAIRSLGGAVSLIPKIKRAIKKAKQAIAKYRANKRAGAARGRTSACCASPGSCFAGSTLVLLASGALLPIDTVQLGDLVPHADEQGASFGLGVAPESPERVHRVADVECSWLHVSGVVDAPPHGVRVEILRPGTWPGAQVWSEDGTAPWIDIPDVGVAGWMVEPTIRSWPRPQSWDGIEDSGGVPVTGVFQTVSNDLLELTLGGEELLVTSDHWLWSATRSRWVRARDADVGELLLSATGEVARIESIDVALPELGAVWNLEVAGAAAYHVGEGSWLVHNGCGDGLTTPGKFFGDKTPKEARDALGSKFGSPRSSRPGADTFYNPKTGRSYNVHTDPAHGPPHVDIRTRGPVPDRKVPLGGGN